MKLYELNTDQLNELKVNYFTAKLDARGDFMTWNDIFQIDELVTMEELETQYGCTEFSKDDFCCTAEITIEYYRKPTSGEIAFGYGATHYVQVFPSMVTKKDGTLKKRFKGTDGLIYCRA